MRNILCSGSFYIFHIFHIITNFLYAFMCAKEWGSRGLEFESRHSDQKWCLCFCTDTIFYSLLRDEKFIPPCGGNLDTRTKRSVCSMQALLFLCLIFENSFFPYTAKQGALAIGKRSFSIDYTKIRTYRARWKILRRGKKNCCPSALPYGTLCYKGIVPVRW